ncbi:hypothetical protein TTHERM_001281660 (macronuclear) [Tetrahymena thermophila SB210]|uniref:Uncharacterized protein n=1 Tax=Tetrahymena thermophila (strain SB210) TaxID=312017 RepID=W7WXI4_TETTS|nr:hypothetical protein TTHERM_001281660 [Tetrahymena thermophila SB210]EWS71515.1 hypothetical protein TTHERM_001281660 [Tetrahymena thermophila SB210]|eukprot:XP_012655951.1 hypothetical protein TTHERM_001281660 [Tetrahymena thermophila SB210]
MNCFTGFNLYHGLMKDTAPTLALSSYVEFQIKLLVMQSQLPIGSIGCRNKVSTSCSISGNQDTYIDKKISVIILKLVVLVVVNLQSERLWARGGKKNHYLANLFISNYFT